MVSRTIVPALALLAGLLPLSARAQGTSKFTFAPSFRAHGVYDDNLFSTPEGAEVGSYYLRFTPAFASGYESTSFSFNAGYGFDSELYPDERSELTDAFASQRANIGLGYAMTRTASISFDASYRTSNRPSDLVEDTGLELGRRNSESYRAGLTFNKQLSTQDSWNVGYNASLLEYDGSDSDSISHGISTGWSHRYSTLTTTQLQYSYRQYSFGDELSGVVLGGRTARSHLLTFGWTRQLGERTSVTLQLGPRLSNDFVNINASEELELNTESAVGADAGASINYGRNNTSLSLAYSRHENQVFSRSGFVDTDSVVFRFGQGAGRSFHFGVSPGVYRNTRGSAETWTYRASVDARQGLTEWIHFTARYQYSLQDGRFVDTFGSTVVDPREFDRNVVTFGLTFGHTFEQ